jgi:hypothetical protein
MAVLRGLLFRVGAARAGARRDDNCDCGESGVSGACLALVPQARRYARRLNS